ncbi:peptidoglycan bridge formation glycyltransferase FemA/FemB family protein [Winogradskyella sp.]|uniref:peptidoglycan bridge formation glycyltransferase FemA/FemB family protein n=1 Tax=Winogradskyella sp. TaxID=1883156 RepID=UPI0025F236EE|nr:peptidoglycan bridge formation glycyltransferase FemA/FemB family protein [Winogradskyella sp.]
MINEVVLKKDWNHILNKIGNYDFYHTYDYHSISIGKNEVSILLVFKDDTNIIALPLVLRPIENTPYFDFTSVYGYSGPLTNITDTDYDYSKFQSKLNTYFKEKDIISVFSRLHPYIEQDTILNNLGDVIDLGKVVNIDVSLPIEESRRAYGKSNKNQVNKLKRQCTVHKAKTKEDILEFVDIYHENMHRLDAEDYYFFDKDYFLNFMEIEDFKTDILLVKDNETDSYIAGSMFVKTNDMVQFHLSGTRTDFLRMKPSKLFLDEMRLEATEEGFTYFNLGGGLGSQEDSLFEFKASFSKDFKIFKIWKYIVNQVVYDELSTNSKDSGFFPKYREGQH